MTDQDLPCSSRHQAVKELSVAFKPYITVDRVAAMYKTVQERQNQCRGLVTEEFESLSVALPETKLQMMTTLLTTYLASCILVYSFVPESNKPPVNPSTLSDACTVVDVLGDEVRSVVYRNCC